MDVEAELKALIKRQAGEKADSLAADTRLADIGLDSIDLVEVAFEIEDRFHIRVMQNSEEIATATFGDLVKLVRESLAANGAIVPLP